LFSWISTDYEGFLKTPLPSFISILVFLDFNKASEVKRSTEGVISILVFLDFNRISPSLLQRATA